MRIEVVDRDLESMHVGSGHISENGDTGDDGDEYCGWLCQRQVGSDNSDDGGDGDC